MGVETVGAILLRDGDILLGRRASHKSFAGCWDVVGGHVEAGETGRSALARELAEELGIVARIGARVDTIDVLHGDGLRVPLHLYAVADWEGVPRLNNDEHDELRWFPLAQAASLPRLVAEDYRRIFVRLRGGSQLGRCAVDPVDAGR